jgi:hypothetical protein
MRTAVDAMGFSSEILKSDFADRFGVEKSEHAFDTRANRLPSILPVRQTQTKSGPKICILGPLYQ